MDLMDSKRDSLGKSIKAGIEDVIGETSESIKKAFSETLEKFKIGVGNKNESTSGDKDKNTEKGGDSEKEGGIKGLIQQVIDLSDEGNDLINDIANTVEQMVEGTDTIISCLNDVNENLKKLVQHATGGGGAGGHASMTTKVAKERTKKTGKGNNMGAEIGKALNGKQMALSIGKKLAETLNPFALMKAFLFGFLPKLLIFGIILMAFIQGWFNTDFKTTLEIVKTVIITAVAIYLGIQAIIAAVKIALAIKELMSAVANQAVRTTVIVAVGTASMSFMWMIAIAVVAVVIIVVAIIIYAVVVAMAAIAITMALVLWSIKSQFKRMVDELCDVIHNIADGIGDMFEEISDKMIAAVNVLTKKLSEMQTVIDEGKKANKMKKLEKTQENAEIVAVGGMSPAALIDALMDPTSPVQQIYELLNNHNSNFYKGIARAKADKEKDGDEGILDGNAGILGALGAFTGILGMLGPMGGIASSALGAVTQYVAFKLAIKPLVSVAEDIRDILNNFGNTNQLNNNKIQANSKAYNGTITKTHPYGSANPSDNTDYIVNNTGVSTNATNVTGIEKQLTEIIKGLSNIVNALNQKDYRDPLKLGSAKIDNMSDAG